MTRGELECDPAFPWRRLFADRVCASDDGNKLVITTTAVKHKKICLIDRISTVAPHRLTLLHKRLYAFHGV